MAEDQPKNFDELWDFDRPALSEERFEVLRDTVRATPDLYGMLLTQIARAQGLQERFEEAHRTLDEGEALVPNASDLLKVCCLLERGRLYNSAGQPSRATPFFREALAIAEKAGEEYHAIDAAHMLAISDPIDQLTWNEIAVELARKATTSRAQGWLGSLYNNMGWGFFAEGKYEQALEQFQAAERFREERGSRGELRIARWCIARTLRALGRTEDALAIQQELESNLGPDDEPDGYIFEELGECLIALGRVEEARAWFARAFETLSANARFAATEPERLSRMRQLGHGG